MYRFVAGDRVVFRGYVNPISDSTNSYSRLMRARGYTGRTYISQYSHVVVAPTKAGGLTTAVRKFQSAATSRLSRLALPPAEMAVATAMTTGDRRAITPTLRQSYSRTGASHLLAVSGLHVGIAFLIINTLLYLLPLARRGHIAKNIVAVVAIWVYAAMVGLAPSVVRAAVMFTGAQLALASSRPRSGVNIMAGTAFVMLAVKPLWLLDISFQLSFIAVAGIMAWFPALYRLVESRWRGLNALWGMLLVGAVASVATMPLVSHTFGVFSPVGIVLNPLIVLTANVVVCFSLLWIIAPVSWLAPVFEWVVGGAAWLQNRVVELTEAVRGVSVEWQMPTWAVFVVYGAMIIFTVWLVSRPPKETPFELPR
jgi:competence protein ComEC